MITKEDLIKFERKIADLYESGAIKSPIHLRGGNEDQLIEIFKQIRPQDRICTSWASHLEILLKGVPEEEITQAILNNKSITLCFEKYKIISSAIVSGICSIAVGFSLAAKRKNVDEITYCFIGDMTFLNGNAQEMIRYSDYYNLPIRFVVADNGLSVKTPTCKVWNIAPDEIARLCKDFYNVVYYKYTNTWPHSGTGKFVNLW